MMITNEIDEMQHKAAGLQVCYKGFHVAIEKVGGQTIAMGGVQVPLGSRFNDA